MEDLLYKIAITRIPSVGAITARNLISYCGSPQAVFEARKRELLRIPGIGEHTAGNVLRKDALLEAETEIRFLERHGIQALYYMDDLYPRRLRHYPDCPILLYYRGEANLNADRVVAIVGTRRPTVKGRAFCESLVESLRPYDVLIVSGLAFGIDVTAHRQCVKAGIPTVGVLGHGFNRIYPPQHRSVAEQMIRQGGLLTEYPSHVKPDREHFPMRNRIIAGMCDALVVVETARRGGSMISAEIANAYNKDVFAVPGRIHDPQSKGCNHLIKAHKAALLESAADIAYIMRWEEPASPSSSQTSLFQELTEEEKIIVDLLRQKETAGIDELCVLSRLTNSALASLLLNLEFKGLIKTLPGKRYTLLAP